MNQALYAHMNNKRKMEKKKKESFMLISMAVGTKNGLGKSVRR
jgi:hypothetical protein